MPFDKKHRHSAARKLNRDLAQIEKASSPAAIQRFCTDIRRVEILIEELTPEPDRNTRKLLKSTHRLRKKADRLRDLDAQILLLRNLKIARESSQKSHLLRALLTDRLRKEEKLIGVLDKDSVREFRKRMSRAGSDLGIPDSANPTALALQILSGIARDRSPLTPKLIHQYWIAGTRASYLVESAESDKALEVIAEQSKKLHDIIGEWQDWLNLTERAEEIFGGVKQSPLVAALRNLTRAKFREGVDAIVQIRPTLSGEKGGLKSAPASARKPMLVESKKSSVAA